MGCSFPHFFAGVIDGSELGIDDFRDDIVVEADDSDVVGYAQAGLFECLQEDGGAEVVGDEDPVGSWVHFHDLAGRADGSFFAQVVYDEAAGVIRKTVGSEGVLESFESAGIYISVKAGCEVGDMPASLLCEVSRCFKACVDIINDDTGPVLAFFGTVEEYDRYSFLEEGAIVVEVPGIEGEGGDEAVHAFVKKVMGVGSFFLKGFGGVADDQIVACCGGNFFYARQDRADELAFQLMDDDPDSIGLLSSKVTRKGIGAIAHFPGHIENTFACFNIDGGMVFESPADGGGGEVQFFGDIINGDLFLGCHIC